MDDMDRSLLRQVQEGLPLAPRPFYVLGEELGISEDEVISRLENLKNRGIIRRLGGVFDSRRLGYVSALCAMKAETEQVDKLAAMVNAYPGVTHNYLRDDVRLNLWFTLTCLSQDEFTAAIAEMEAGTGVRIHCFPVLHRYKIKFFLPLDEEEA